MLNFIWFFLWCIPCRKSYCCQQFRIYHVKITSQSWNPKAISKSNLLQKVGYFSWTLLKVPADFKLSELGNTHGMELISSWDHSSVIGRKQDFCVNIVLISCKTFTISLVFNLKNFKSFITVSFCNEISFPKFPLVSNQTHRKTIPLPYTLYITISQ